MAIKICVVPLVSNASISSRYWPSSLWCQANACRKVNAQHFPIGGHILLLLRLGLRHRHLDFPSSSVRVAAAKRMPGAAVFINGKAVPIPDLPQSELALRYVPVTDVDVTKLVRSGTGGQQNLIELHYNTPKLYYPKAVTDKRVGTLSLSLTIVISEASQPQAPQTPKNKFCWFCQYPLAYEAKFCSNCGHDLSNIGVNPKKCVKCGCALPANSLFCDVDGSPQPTT